MKKFGANLVSNIATKLWSMLSIYIFVPLYIKILGETAYGLVSFFATLQTALNLLGLGLSNTLRREFAVGEDTHESLSRKYILLRGIENVYFCIGVIIVVFCLFGSRWISERWLDIETLNSNMVADVLTLMGASIALQMIANLYAGCLFGLDCQVYANALHIAWSAVKSVGAFLVIFLIKPSLLLFYSWHIVSDVVYLLALRLSTIRKLCIKSSIKWSFSDFSALSSIWKYARGVLIISFIALINKQLDKVIISRYLPLTEVGAYNVATTLGNLCAVVPMSIYMTVFPRFTKYATTCKNIELEREFLAINKIVNLIISSTGAFVSVYALPLLNIWTHSDIYVNVLGNTAFYVVLAVAIAEYQEIPYALALANGNTKFNVIIGTIFLPLVFLFTYFGIISYGLIGAGIVYMLMMAAQTVTYEYLVYRNYLLHSAILLILRDTVIPLSLSLVIAWFSSLLIKCVTSSIIICIYAVFWGALTLALLMLVCARKDITLIFSKKEN